jgi:hypothetical protein
MTKPAFPQTPSGVTDWEKVFEDPNEGLIAVIASAPNAAALKSCLEAVTRQLFTRKGDELEITRVAGEIERMFANAGGDTPTDDAVALLRTIKDLRIRKAQEFLARKHADAADRRAKEAGGVKRLAYLFFKEPKYLIGATVAMLALAGYLYVALNDLSTETAETAETPPEASSEAPAAPPLPDGVVVIPPVGAPADTVPHTQPAGKPGAMSGIAAAMPTQRRSASRDEDRPPPTIVFRHVSIPRPFVPARGAASTVLPVAVMAERGVVADICDIAPVIYHMVNIALSDAANAGSNFDDFDLDRMAGSLQGKINRELGKPLIARMILIRDAGKAVYARHECSQAPEAMVRRLNLSR